MKTTGNIKRYLLLLVLTIGSMLPAFAQQINLDKIVKAGELTLFQELRNPKTWYYLVDKPRLARGKNGMPKFSFLRYVENVRSGANEEERREGDGGGILHALIELGVTEEQRQEAESDLQNIVPGAKIMGPVMYKEGEVTLISSFVKPGSDLSKQFLGKSKAPILDGHQAAFSIELTKKGAKILWESFKTPTPDMSVSFDMKLGGFRSPIRAMIEVDFDKIYSHKDFQVGIATPILAAKIKGAFEDMRQNGAIKVTQIGSDDKMEEAINLAYSTIFSKIFEPIQDAPPEAEADMLDKARTILTTARTDAKGSDNQNNTAAATDDEGKGNTNTQRKKIVPFFAAAGSFRIKKIRRRGKFIIDLNKYNTDAVKVRFDENFGSIRCRPCFRQVNLDDPLFKQRELVAFIDGANAADFGNYINFVTLSMKKKHQSGTITNDEVRIDRKNFNKQGNYFKLLYGWKGDNDRSKWMDYEYKTSWNFFGGHAIETDWIKSDRGAISLAPPLLRKTIILEADPETVRASGIRAIDVRLLYHIGDKQYIKSVTLRRNELSKTTDIILPENADEFEYEVFWTLRRNKRIASVRQKTNSDVLFVDELPEEEIIEE